MFLVCKELASFPVLYFASPTRNATEKLSLKFGGKRKTKKEKAALEKRGLGRFFTGSGSQARNKKNGPSFKRCSELKKRKTCYKLVLLFVRLSENLISGDQFIKTRELKRAPSPLSKYS